MRLDALEEKVQRRIEQSIEGTFFPSDFFDLSERGRIFRVLRRLIQKKILLRVGRGIYVRAKISALTNEPIPEQNLRAVAVCVLEKLGIKVLPTRFEREYKSGLSAQVPTGLVIGVDKKVNKKIGFNGRYIKYEKMAVD